MRVLHVVEASFAGVGRHVVDLVNGLGEVGVDNDVLYSPTRASRRFIDDLERTDAAVHHTPMSRAPSIHTTRATRLAATIARRGGIDVIHGHSTGGGVVARLAGRVVGTPAVFTPNAFLTLQPDVGRLPALAYRAIERGLRRQTSALICVSPEEHTHALGLRYTPRRSFVVQNGIERQAPDLNVTLVGKLAALRSDPAERIIGFVGRLDGQKRPDLLIAAFDALINRLGEQKVRLLVVGEGSLDAALRTQVDRLGITDRVTFLGVQDGPAMMASFDVLAVPSAYEGFPYVVLEALRAGTPVVVSREVPVASFGSDPAGIDVVDAADADAFAAALRRMLSARPSPAAVRATQLPFTIEAMARQTLAVYRTVTEAGAGQISGRV